MQEAEKSNCNHSSSTTLGLRDLFLCMDGETAAVLQTGATANLACLWRLEHHNEISERTGIPQVTTYPGRARFKFGDGRLREIHCAADSLAGIAGSRGEFTAFALEADIIALFRKGALAAQGG